MAWSGIHSALWYMEELFLLGARGFMILQGFRDETFGMPIVAVVINISWAFWFSFYVNNVYFIDQVSFFAHLAILFQVIVYGPKEFFDGKRLPLYLLLAACTVTSLGLMRAVIDEEGRSWTHNQLFYGCMFVTSVLFVQMLLSRGDARGQNMVVAVCKFAGLVCGWLYQHPAVISWLCFGALVADVVYIYLLYLCMDKPQDFHQWRSYLVSSIDGNSSSNTGNPNGQMVNSHIPVVYHPPMHPPLMTGDEGENNKNNVELLGGMPS